MQMTIQKTGIPYQRLEHFRSEMIDNMQKSESKNAHLCHNVVIRIKIIYLFYMLSHDYAKMNNFYMNKVKMFQKVAYIYSS